MSSNRTNIPGPKVLLLVVAAIALLAAAIYYASTAYKPVTPRTTNTVGGGEAVSGNTSAPEGTVPFRIDPAVVRIEYSDLLPTDNWKIYRNETFGYEIKYSKDWFVFEPHPAPPPGEVKNYIDPVYFSPTATAEPSGAPWARVTLGIEKKESKQSLEEWLRVQAETPGPGTDVVLQYVSIPYNITTSSGEVIEAQKKFLGTYEFNTDKWKNAYFELASDKVLILSFINKGADSDFSEIYYTMIQTLKLPNQT